jgi:hypothetical protein
MLELGLKDSTKDIDVVCRIEEDEEWLLRSAKSLGFQIVGPERRHARLGVNRLAVKGGRNLDIFAGRISYDFGSQRLCGKGLSSPDPLECWLSGTHPWKTSSSWRADRQPARGCQRLRRPFSTVLDFDAVYREIEAQYRKAGEVEQKIWITYIEEWIGRLEEVHNLEVPIGDKVSKLADEYRERLYQKLSPSEEV